jgi:hypothetical protein
MNTGQTILTLGALVLLTIAILNFNKAVVGYDASLDSNRYRLEALSLLTSHIEKCNQYFFDEASTDTSNEKSLSDFTAPASLGLEINDYGSVDDFDDFNNMTVNDTGGSGIVYNVSFKVEYVRVSSNQIVISTNREYNKRMKISITDSYTPPLLTKLVSGASVRDTLSISYVYSYWFYN